MQYYHFWNTLYSGEYKELIQSDSCTTSSLSINYNKQIVVEITQKPLRDD